MYLSKKDFKPDWVTNNALKYDKKIFKNLCCHVL